MQGRWLPILEYVRVTNSSISTIRRHIKKNKVLHKSENGKYFVFCDEEKYQNHIMDQDKDSLTMQLENLRLKNEVNRLREEVQEQKMLLRIYEEKLTPIELPELPI